MPKARNGEKTRVGGGGVFRDPLSDALYQNKLEKGHGFSREKTCLRDIEKGWEINRGGST